ncbi:MAG: hypothetical protein JWO44_2677 [Bacteroidetes bacterium]|nr:hypothetical protein [Bacteroidota bacterium]
MMLACCSDHPGNNGVAVKAIDTVPAAPVSDTVLTKPEPVVSLFEYSDCKEACNDDERLISRSGSADSLFLRIGAIENCEGRFRPEIKLSHDTLAIDIKIQERYVKRKNGKTDTIIVSQECDCYFFFSIGIKNLPPGYKTILFDGHRIGSRKAEKISVPDEDIIYKKKKDSI